MKLVSKNITARNFILILSLIILILFYLIITCRWLGEDKRAWRRTVDSDGRGYYAYLPAVFIFKDLHFDFIKEQEDIVFGKGSSEFLWLQNHERGNKYFIGVAIFLIPFFLLATVVSQMLGYPVTGYNPIYFGSVSLAALFYLVVALVLIRKLLMLYKVRDVWINIILVLLVFGTNVCYYLVILPSISHIYSFCAIAAFIYFLKRFMDEGRNKHLYLTAVTLGLITLLRPVNIIILLAVPFLCENRTGFLGFIKKLFGNKSRLLLSVLIYSAIVFLEPLILYLTYGDFFRWPYQGERFNFALPHFLEMLFSYRRGFFVYTPLMFLAILFVFRRFKERAFAITSFMIFFLVQNYIFSSWEDWSYGGSYGMRVYIEFYPLFIIPFAAGVNEIVKKWKLVLLSILLVALVWASLVQSYQYQKKIIIPEMNKDIYWKVFLRTGLKNKLLASPVKLYYPPDDSIVARREIINNFEGALDWGAQHSITDEDYFSPNHCVKINKDAEFSPVFSMSFDSLLKEKIDYVKVSAMTKLKEENTEGSMIISFEMGNQKIFEYDQSPIITVENKIDTWTKFIYGVRIPFLRGEGTMKIYAWNFTAKPVLLDDLQIELLSLKH